MARPGIKGLIKVMSSFYFATFGVFPVKTVILANVRPFGDKLIYFGCLFNTVELIIFGNAKTYLNIICGIEIMCARFFPDAFTYGAFLLSRQNVFVQVVHKLRIFFGYFVLK